MQLQAYSTSTTRRRLSGQLKRRGAQSGMSTVGALLFGSVFVAVGTAIILIGTNILHVNNLSVHVPSLPLTGVGILCSCGGLTVWSMAWSQYCAKQNSRSAARQHPENPALQDYSWDPHGFKASRWKPVIKGILGCGFMTLFLSFFNYWAFMAGGPLLVKAVVGLFDLLLIYGWYQGVLAVGRALKFGNSRIEFIQFPYRLTTPINIRWKAPSGIVHANKGSFTLRCVEEWFEQRGSGKNRGQFLVQEEVWRGTWFLNEPATFTRNEESELHFEPPAKLPSTSLLTHRAVYWELEAKLDLPGLDFEECYLVPVY